VNDLKFSELSEKENILMAVNYNLVSKRFEGELFRIFENRFFRFFELLALLQKFLKWDFSSG
jgi:hypothetical protein